MDQKQLKELRRALDLTQQDMAAKLGITRNYLALMETGRRRVPAPVLNKIETLLQGHALQTVDKGSASAHVCEEHAAYVCRVPADCDVAGELAEIKTAVDDLKGQMATLLGLLGEPLREAIRRDQDNDKRSAG